MAKYGRFNTLKWLSMANSIQGMSEANAKEASLKLIELIENQEISLEYYMAKATGQEEIFHQRYPDFKNIYGG